MEGSFSRTFSECISTRKQYSNLFKVPSSFEFVQDEDGADSILFLYDSALYSSGVRDFQLGIGSSWKRILGGDESRLISRSEQLLKERMRQVGSSTKFECVGDNTLLFVDGSKPQLRTYKGDLVTSFPSCEGAFGFQTCPLRNELVAFLSCGDIFIMNGQTKCVQQLTFTKDVPNVSAGLPSYVIQEEFDRYTGFWWRKDCEESDIFYIIYEEVNEDGVEIVHSFDPVSQTVENYCYPRPGRKNATSELKLLVLKVQDGQQEFDVEERRLAVPLSELFPQCNEYLVRFGWMPGGNDVWIQLLDRLQNTLILAVVNIGSFVGEHCGAASLPQVYVLYEERNAFWVPVHDCLEFLPVDSGSAVIRFVWLSQKSGHKHLYLIEAVLPSSNLTDVTFVPTAHYSVHSITQGNWSVLGSKIWVDVKSLVIYFVANEQSPLEKHLYVVDLEGKVSPRQLTKSGFFHDVTLDSRNFKYFMTVASSWASNVSVSVHSLADVGQSLSEWHGPKLPDVYTPPTPFSVKSDTGEELYGAVYSPEVVPKEGKVPAIVYVYGGPGVQFVTRCLSKHLPRIQTWRHQGFAVIMLDNRGSANRGIQFEAYVKGNMGQVEVEDQVLGVQAAAKSVDFIDMSRIGIMGWSYGGYLSLLAIAKYPDIFKACVSGAPVTEWCYYDTAYTERYLGLPKENSSAYMRSSVLQKVSSFPADPGRVLLIHGLCDENVLFTHTASLCDRFVALGKPYSVQFYSKERHGLRSFSSVVHCDSTIVHFFSANL